MINVILDASVFSRAAKYIDPNDFKKFYPKEEMEITLGRLTSMNGTLLKLNNVKVRSSPERTSDGKAATIIEQVNNVYAKFQVPAGATFSDVIAETEKEGFYPALFPMYLEGTVGGFVATNGSGFGSYRFGFVNFKKPVHVLENDNVKMLAVKYNELLESKTEIPYAWSGIIYEDGTTLYYSPVYYSSLISEQDRGNINTGDLIKKIHQQTKKVIKRDYIPVILRTSVDNLPRIKSSFNMDYACGYVINHNSPSKQGVLIGSIEESRISDLMIFLKSNAEVYPWPSLSEYEEIHKFIINKLRILKKPEVKIPKRFTRARNEYIDSMKCINCGICLNSCLSFKITKNPLYSPPGRFGRILTERDADFCFGCKECEESCPVGIQISSIMEVLPKFNETYEKLSVDTPKASLDIKQMVMELDSKYRNKPVFLLVSGCATKYDPLGLKGFLGFLHSSNGNLPPGMSPRVNLIDGECCGFPEYISGNEEEARKYVMRIRELKEQVGAQGVYFLCPEGLYVYNKLSEDNGILAYDILKANVNQEEVHAGCWAKKLGITGGHGECAGVWAMSYKGGTFPITVKNYSTICPFSTWKFGTASVYSKFVIKDIGTQQTSSSFNDTDLVEIIIDSVKRSLLNAADEIAGKVYFWKSGGSQYFILISSSIAKKYFYKTLFENITKNQQLKEATKEIIANKTLFNEKINSISEIISHQSFDDAITKLQQKILQSPNLEYSMKDVVNSNDFLNALNRISKLIITPSIISDALAEAAYL
jgi:heterodisulfide reductase subunit C